MNTVAAASSELPPTTIASTSIGTVAFVNSVPLKLTSGAQTPAMTRIPSAMANTAATANRMVSTLRTPLCFMIFLLPQGDAISIPHFLYLEQISHIAQM